MYLLHCSLQRRRAAQGYCVWVQKGRNQVQDLHCRTSHLLCLAGQAGRTAHLSRAPRPGLAHRNNSLLSIEEKRLSCLVIKCINNNHTYKKVTSNICFFWSGQRIGHTCLSSCSRFVMDNGASNGFSSFSVSNVVCVFVTAPARGSRNTYFLYLENNTKV